MSETRTCPYCGSTKTELLALFGQQLLTVQMYCQHCHTPFEYIKDDEIVETGKIGTPGKTVATRKGTQA